MDKTHNYHIEPYHMNGLNWRIVPDDPTRDNIVVVTGFMPSWWSHEYGLTFSREFHVNADVHKRTLAQIESILQERFGDLPHFFCGDRYAESYPTERRYGDALIPALFGADVSFDDASGHPYAHFLHITDEEAADLTVPDVASHPVFTSIVNERENVAIPTTGELGFEGVVNIAYRLRGQEMFVDLVEKRSLIHHVFSVVYETIDDMVHLFRQWQDPTLSKPTHFVNCNCLVNMMSPRMYRDNLVEFDKRFHESFGLFGVHTCNWTVDPYLDCLAEIGELAYLDMGPKSDIGKVHELFPDLACSVFFGPEKFRALGLREIRKEITELGKRIERGYILLSDLEAGTTDGQVREAYEAASQL